MTNRNRKIPRMPVEELHRNPLAMTLPAAGFGMLFRLVLHFWVTRVSAAAERRQRIVLHRGRSSADMAAL